MHTHKKHLKLKKKYRAGKTVSKTLRSKTKKMQAKQKTKGSPSSCTLKVNIW